MLTIGAAATVITAGVFAAAPAMAGTGPATVKVNTHQNGVADTTDRAGSATKDSPNGPVWAYDNLERKITAVPDPSVAGQWTVTVESTGSYSAFADPRTGGPASFSTGPVQGYVTYVVQAGSLQPSAANLGSQSSLALHSFDLVQHLFGGAVTQTGGGDYSFSYKLAGLAYTQHS